mgnify:CR=1 FL=1
MASDRDFPIPGFAARYRNCRYKRSPKPAQKIRVFAVTKKELLHNGAILFYATAAIIPFPFGAGFAPHWLGGAGGRCDVRNSASSIASHRSGGNDKGSNSGSNAG